MNSIKLCGFFITMMTSLAMGAESAREAVAPVEISYNVERDDITNILGQHASKPINLRVTGNVHNWGDINFEGIFITGFSFETSPQKFSPSFQEKFLKSLNSLSAKLQTFRLFSVVCNPQLLFPIFFRFPHLASLELEWLGIEVDHAKILSLQLKETRSLRRLNLSHNGLKVAGLKALEEGILLRGDTLEVLNLEDNGIGVKGAEMLGKDLIKMTRLQEFNLSDNKLGAEGIKALDVDSPSFGILRILSLASNNPECIPDVAKGLSSLLKRTKCLQWLNLCGNWLGSAGMVELEDAFSSLGNTLEELNLESNNIGDEGAKAFSRPLGKMIRLRNLNLSNNMLKVAGMKALESSLLLRGDTLEVLNLANNQTGDEGVQELCSVLKTGKMKRLRKLNLFSNGLTKSSKESLKLALPSCPTLEELDLGFNSVGDDPILDFKTQDRGTYKRERSTDADLAAKEEKKGASSSTT